MEIYQQLHYRFMPAQVEVKGVMREVAAIPVSKSKAVEQLDNFIMATKAVVDGPIPYSDNILPTLQKRILRKEAEFKFIMKDGWINNIIPPT